MVRTVLPGAATTRRTLGICQALLLPSATMGISVTRVPWDITAQGLGVQQTTTRFSRSRSACATRFIAAACAKTTGSRIVTIRDPTQSCTTCKTVSHESSTQMPRMPIANSDECRSDARRSVRVWVSPVRLFLAFTNRTHDARARKVRKSGPEEA